MSNEDGLINIQLIPENCDWILSGNETKGYRPVMPVELCAHDHGTQVEAVACGVPRLIALSSILHEIGKSALSGDALTTAQKREEQFQEMADANKKKAKVKNVQG